MKKLLSIFSSSFLSVTSFVAVSNVVSCKYDIASKKINEVIDSNDAMNIIGKKPHEYFKIESDSSAELKPNLEEFTDENLKLISEKSISIYKQYKGIENSFKFLDKDLKDSNAEKIEELVKFDKENVQNEQWKIDDTKKEEGNKKVSLLDKILEKIGGHLVTPDFQIYIADLAVLRNNLPFFEKYLDVLNKEPDPEKEEEQKAKNQLKTTLDDMITLVKNENINFLFKVITTKKSLTSNDGAKIKIIFEKKLVDYIQPEKAIDNIIKSLDGPQGNLNEENLKNFYIDKYFKYKEGGK